MSGLKFQKRATGPYLVARLYRSVVLRTYRFAIHLVSPDGVQSDVVSGSAQVGTLFPSFGRFRRPRFSLFRRGVPPELVYVLGQEFHSAVFSARNTLEAAIQSLDNEEHDYPLVVFAQAENSADSAPWCEALEFLLNEELSRPGEVPKHGARPVEVVVFPAKPTKSQVPLEKSFRLPVNIVAPSALVSSLLDAEYYLRDENVAKHVLSVRPLPEEWSDPPGTDLSIRRFESEVPALEWLQDARSATRVRVAILPLFHQLTRPLRLVDGTACIVVVCDGEWERRFFRKFMRELVHDRSLSTVLSIAVRETGFQETYFPRRYFRGEPHFPNAKLYCDPSTDNWLRFSNALPVVADAAHELRHFAGQPDVNRLSDELMNLQGESEAVRAFAGALKAAGDAVAPSMSALSDGIQFTRESTGVEPMARVLKSSTSPEVAAFHAQLEALKEMPELLSALDVAQQRRVDAQLETFRHGSFVGNNGSGVVSADEVRLTIHIGQRGQQSLMSDDAPALDPMLPELAPNESHAIDIVVFPKDFTLLQTSPACQTVQLPRFGGSEPVHWTLKAPVLGTEQDLVEGVLDERESTRAWKDGDEAELRFNVYFKNQLLQSFSVTATVHNEAYWRGKSGAVCDFSQTSRFGHLEDFSPRFATLALNKGKGDSHLLSLRDSKRDACSVEWQGSFLSKRLEAVRGALLQSLAPDGDSPFGFNLETLACTPMHPDAFKTAVRRLARAGAALCNQLALKDASDEVLTLLEDIQQTSDKTIQVALLDPSYSLPWGLLYDYKVAEDEWDALPICDGFTAPAFKCTCQPDSGSTICLRGFWGFRHYIEQLCGVNEADPTVAKVIAGKPTSPPLAFVQGISDEFSDELEKQLRPLATGLDHISTPTQLLEKYRNPEGRPSVILFMGHMEQADAEDAGNAKLLNQNKSTFLSVNDIGFEVRKRRFWTQPRSLVLLIACGSGQQGPVAGVGLSGGLVRLNAIGVLGTECTVYTGIGSRIARDVLSKLNQPAKDGQPGRKSIGVALRETAWELAQEGCPLGLAFTYVGSMEATLP